MGSPVKNGEGKFLVDRNSDSPCSKDPSQSNKQVKTVKLARARGFPRNPKYFFLFFARSLASSLTFLFNFIRFKNHLYFKLKIKEYSQLFIGIIRDENFDCLRATLFYLRNFLEWDNVA
jgi:hypothetical protein